MKAATQRQADDGLTPQHGVAGGGPTPVTPTRSLGARRRRPALIALSIALIAVGGLGSAAFYTMGDERIEVLAVARVVPYGDTIEAEDLRVVEINDAQGLSPLGASARAGVIGKRAAVELRPGTLLTRDQVAERISIAPGQMLVPVAVDTSRMPVQRITPGTEILIVSTPESGANVPETPPRTIKGTVTRSSMPSGDRGSGKAVLDVAVPAVDGAVLAARVFSGRFAIVVLNTGNADPAPTAPGGAA